MAATELFKRFKLLAPNSIVGYLAAILLDTAIGFVLSLPGFVFNYGLSGCGWMPSVVLGIKASATACWTSSISGGLFDTFNAFDSDDARKKDRVPILIRRAVIDRFELETRRKLIWVCLAASVVATAAIYCLAPGGLLATAIRLRGMGP